MGINNITLTAELVAALYPDSLVATGPQKPVPRPAYPYQGENLRNIGFVVYSPGVEFLPEAQRTLLGKILTACRCGLQDIALLNAAHTALTFEDLKNQLNPRMLFLWGVPPDAFPLPQIPQLFTAMPFSGTPVVLLPSLENLLRDTDQQLKKKLWVCLQNMFDL